MRGPESIIDRSRDIAEIFESSYANMCRDNTKYNGMSHIITIHITLPAHINVPVSLCPIAVVFLLIKYPYMLLSRFRASLPYGLTALAITSRALSRVSMATHIQTLASL